MLSSLWMQHSTLSHSRRRSRRGLFRCLSAEARFPRNGRLQRHWSNALPSAPYCTRNARLECRVPEDGTARGARVPGPVVARRFCIQQRCEH